MSADGSLVGYKLGSSEIINRNITKDAWHSIRKGFLPGNPGQRANDINAYRRMAKLDNTSRDGKVFPRQAKRAEPE